MNKSNDGPWKSIAKQKTQALQEYFPDYNPAFQTCDDAEAIRMMLKKVFDENEILKKACETYEDLLAGEKGLIK